MSKNCLRSHRQEILMPDFRFKQKLFSFAYHTFLIHIVHTYSIITTFSPCIRTHPAIVLSIKNRSLTQLTYL